MQREGHDVDLRVLGPIEVYDGHKLAVGGPRQRRILAALAMRAGEVVSVDRLADIAWSGEDPPATFERNIRSYINRIRHGLGDASDRLVTASPGYVLEVGPGEVDALELTTLAALADQAYDQGDIAGALAYADDGLALWRGAPYAEFGDEEWVRSEAQRLQEIRTHLVERRCEALVALDRPDDALATLEVLIAEQPYRERPRRLQMLALYRAGRQAEALRCFQTFRSFLADEVGVDPSDELVQLERQVLDQDPALRPSGQSVRALRGYELHDVIGEGAFAQVWRGTQPVLDREVAVKQIRPQLANDPDFIRRFEVEARIVSSLEHPFIVPLYDYWREPGSAYLVMRYLRGGTLETRLHDGPLTEPELQRMVDQIGAALRTAHVHGVMHRDVKPGNILLDEEGNYFLTDFGIAFGLGGDDDAVAALSTGSPAYASPEQLRREQLDARTDIYALGVTLFEAATGRPPFAEERTRVELVRRQLEEPLTAPSLIRAGVPSWLDEVVARATAKERTERYPTVDELVRSTGSTIIADAPSRSMRGATTIAGEARNPFKGLASFTEADAGDFRGRQRLVARLLAALERPGVAGRLVAAVGPSGSGKSSVVRAGLIPALRQGALSGSADWFLTTMMPGAHPFEELEGALMRVAAVPPGRLVESMAETDRGIARAVKQVIPDERSELVLVIDQFEELFTLVGEEDRRARFIEGLLAAVKEPRSRLRVVLTVRADFWDRPLRYPALASLLETAAVTVSPLSADELERAIVDPVTEQGMAYEPGLVARITAEVVDQPGALPLLQYALTELFDHNVSGLLTAAEFDAMGGVGGSLAQRAEDLHETQSAEQQDATRRLFGRLVTLGEGSEDTRRRVTVTELGNDRATAQLIEAFGKARLLSFDRHPVSREPTVEVAHEALIREWPRLRDWIEADRDTLRAHRHLTAAAASWRAADEDPAELYRGGRLESAEMLLDHPRVALNHEEVAFLRAAVARRSNEEETERRRVRRLRRLLVTTGVVAIVALIAGAVAWRQQQRADDQAALAQANAEQARNDAVSAATNRALADERAAEAEAARVAGDVERLRALALATAPDDPVLAGLLAIEAHQAEPSSESLDVLHHVLTARPGFRGAMDLDHVIFEAVLLDDGVTLVGATDRALEVIDLGTRQVVQTLPYGASARTVSLAASGDGDVVAVRADNEQVLLFDITTGASIGVITDDGLIAEVTMSPDGDQLALSRAGGLIEIWDVASQTRLRSIDTRVDVAIIRWSPVADEIAVVDSVSQVSLWDAADGERIWLSEEFGEASALGAHPNAALFSSDGQLLVVDTGRLGGRLRTFDTVDGSFAYPSTARTEREEIPLDALFWVDEASLIVGAPTSETLATYDLANGVSLGTDLNGYSARDVAYSPALGQVVAAGLGVQFWSLDGTGPLEERYPLSAAQRSTLEVDGGTVHAAIAADGSRLLVGAISLTALTTIPPTQEFDLTGPDPGPNEWELGSTLGYAYGPYTMAFNLSGFQLLDPADEPIGPPVPITLDMTDQAASADGRFIALGRQPGLVDLYASTGELIATLDMELDFPGDGSLVLPSFSDDGDYVAATTAPGTTAVWSTATLERLDHLPNGGGRLVGDVLVKREGRGLQVLDPATGDQVGDLLLSTPNGAFYHALDKTNGRLAAPGNRSVKIYDLETGARLGRELPIQGLRVGYTADGSRLMVPTAEGVSLWNYDTDTWADIACELAGRNMTVEEWEQLGPRSVERRVTCPQFDLPS